MSEKCMENYFGAILKYRQNKDGIEMMRFEPFRSREEYVRFMKENEGIFMPLKAPATEKEFFKRLGYYSAREIHPEDS